MRNATVLVVDDSLADRTLIEDRLSRQGYRVVLAEDGRNGLRRLYDVRPDLVVLDVVMPQTDGWTVLEHIREISDVPVIMLTGRTNEDERVRGLRGGADDYLGKPFSPAELTARVEAVLRRAPKATAKEIYDDGTVRIDLDNAQVTVRGEPVYFTPLELRFLGVLTDNAGRVLAPHQLLDLVWDDGERSTDQVKLYIGYLRKKLERDPAKPELIENVRGFGYRYNAR
jgi:DNA-binding response OmpR family regulator